MKIVITAMVGIATLVCGVIGSVATAHDSDEAGVHKHEYLFSAIHHKKWNLVRAVAPDGDDVTVDIVVTAQSGADVGSVESQTLPAGRLRRLLQPDELKGNTDANFRTVRITASDEIWIHVLRTFGDHHVNIPVLHRVVPAPTTPPPTDKNNPSPETPDKGPAS